MHGSSQSLVAQWEQLVNRLVFLEKRFVFKKGDLRLHPSELHVLLAIRREPESNATKLAARLGITKGAVSQVLKRLETKNVIGKRIDPSHKNEVTSHFTPLGQEAVEDFLSQRAALQQHFQTYLDSLSEAERAVIQRFLEQFAAVLPGLD
ncbi:MAG: MarR family winged helix-turn-helix transcriptional regulator [Solidesulfovibrio sp.]